MTGKYHVGLGARKGHSLLSLERIKKHIKLTDLEEAMIKFHMGVYGEGYEYTVADWRRATNIHKAVQVFASADMESTMMESQK